MKIASKENVQAALARCQSIETQISQDEQFIATAATELAALEISVDFKDAKGLARVAELQTIAELAPRRLPARQEAFAGAERDLLQECHSFISNHLGPRCRELTAEATKRVRQDLGKHIKEQDALDEAVENSELILELIKIKHPVTIEANPYVGVKNYAEKLIAAWDAAEAFEKTNLN